MGHRLRHKGFFKQRCGGVAIVAAIVLPLLMLSMAAVIDIGRMYAVRNKAQNAADAALLAAAASVSTVDFETEFENMFYANFPEGYLGSKVTMMDPVANPGVGNSAKIMVDTPTIVMNWIPSTMGLENSGVSTIVIEAGTNAPNCDNPNGCDIEDTEIALVLDNSGSMGSGVDGSKSEVCEGPKTCKIDALRAAAKSLVEIVIGPSDTNPKVFISLIPYDVIVQIGANHSDWIQSTPSGPQTPRAEGVSGYEPTKRSARDKYNELVQKKEKGFAAGRSFTYCGPYLYVTDNSKSPAVAQPDLCVCKDSKGKTIPLTCVEVPTVTIDPETGLPTTGSYCKWQCDGTMDCTPQPPKVPPSSAQWRWPDKNSCTLPIGVGDAGDANDSPPTSESTRFNVPYPSTDTDDKFSVLKLQDYTDKPASQVLPPGVNQGNGPYGIQGVKSVKDMPGHWRNLYGLSPETITWAEKLAPLRFGVNSKAEINKAIEDMAISGDTRINIGLMWGWFTLSKNWKGLWDAGKPDLPSDHPKSFKTLVLMTDGKNSIYPTDDDKRTSDLCSAIKAQKITVYTVGLGAPGDIDEALLKGCASKPSFYFYAPTTADLQLAFKQIADSINQEKLKLTK